MAGLQSQPEDPAALGRTPACNTAVLGAQPGTPKSSQERVSVFLKLHATDDNLKSPDYWQTLKYLNVYQKKML